MAKDNSPVVHQNTKYGGDLNIQELPWTPKQKEIIDTALLKDTKMVIIDGIWGAGKGIITTFICLKLLKEKKISNILYIRNIIQSGSGQLGFLKGDQNEKIAPYAVPFIQKLDELLKKSQANNLIKDEIVECQPVALLRGTSYNAYGIIIDEASCMTKEDILLTLSRVGKFCKVFLIGDDYQRDIKNSGFKEIYDTFDDEESRENGIFCYRLQEESDVMRSDFLRFVMKKVRRGDKNKPLNGTNGNGNHNKNV
jgi:predicted ribonuclease YlaK